MIQLQAYLKRAGSDIRTRAWQGFMHLVTASSQIPVHTTINSSAIQSLPPNDPSVVWRVYLWERWRRPWSPLPLDLLPGFFVSRVSRARETLLRAWEKVGFDTDCFRSCRSRIAFVFGY